MQVDRKPEVYRAAPEEGLRQPRLLALQRRQRNQRFALQPIVRRRRRSRSRRRCHTAFRLAAVAEDRPQTLGAAGSRRGSSRW